MSDFPKLESAGLRGARELANKQLEYKIETIASLAAFDPAKLAMKLAHLRSDERIVGLRATGPIVAVPKSDANIHGQFVYDDTKVYVYCGGGEYTTIAELFDVDGNPSLRWLVTLP